MDQEKILVYAKTDAFNRIISVNSSEFVSPDWGEQIDEGYGDPYLHAQGNYFPKPIYTQDGFPRYKLENRVPVERTQEELDAERLPVAKAAKIAKSKADLERYLASHPLTWTDGEAYSITLDKQAQLTATLVSAQVDGEPPEWNTTGGQCRAWDVAELSALGVAIKNRVKALVKYQQGQELAMDAAQTMAELEAIEVNYDTVV